MAAWVDRMLIQDKYNMSKVGNMGDPDQIDVAYKILEKNFVIVPKHLKNLFNKLSLVGIRVWANIQDSQLETFEDVVKGILADDKICQAMSPEERRSLFGDIFWNNPKSFKFLPGDQAVIIQMREVSKELLEKMSSRVQKISNHVVWGTDIKQSAIPIINIDVEIKEEVEEPDKSKADEKKEHRILAPSSNNCDQREDFSVVISDPNISNCVLSVKTNGVAVMDKAEGNSTLSQSNYKESNQEPAYSGSSSITRSGDFNLPSSVAAAPETKTAGTLSTNDWCGKTYSLTKDVQEKESTSCASISTDGWDADTWAAGGVTIENSSEAISNGDQSTWDVSRNFPASSNSKTPSDDWNSWSSTSNSTAPKSNVISISGGNDDWSTSADAWGGSKGTNAGSSQSGGWGSTETVKSTWTGGYSAPRGGRGGGERVPIRPCFKCNEEGHMSFNCHTKRRIHRRGGGGSTGLCFICTEEGHLSYNCPTVQTRGSRKGGGGSTGLCFICKEEGHLSYNCPTGQTRGRGGGKGGCGSTVPCHICNQGRHMSFYCPAASGGSSMNYPASSNDAPNSSTSQSVIDDWGTLTVTPGERSSSYDSGDKNDDWRSTSSSVSNPWATGANTAPRGGRITPRPIAPFRNSQSEVDDWGMSSNSSTVPLVQYVSSPTTSNSEDNDWDSAADAWSSVKTSKSIPQSGNSDSKTVGDDWGAVAESWDECPSGSNSDRGHITNSISSRNGSSAIVKTNEDDWGVAADVCSSSVSNARATPRLPQVEDWNVTGVEKRNDAKFATINHELNQSRMNAIAWNGTINHGRRSFKTNMANLDVNTQSVPSDLEMPNSMRVMGTIEPEKVWTYLKRVRETINERICVFECSPANSAELDGYKFFFDELHGLNRIAVIANAPDSKLPWSFKDFYVVPLAKNSPLELTTLVKKSFLENRTSDLFLGVVVFRLRRSVDESGSNALVTKKTISVPVSETAVESNSIVVQNANAIQLPPPNPLKATHEKEVQNCIVDPIKAIDQTKLSLRRFKIPLLKHASTTPIQTGISDSRETSSSESVQVDLPSTPNFEGPITRSRLRHNHRQQKSNKSSSLEQFAESADKSTEVPVIPRNSTRSIDEIDTSNNQASTSGSSQEKIEVTSSLKRAGDHKNRSNDNKLKKIPKKSNYSSQSTKAPSRCGSLPAKVQKTTGIDTGVTSSSDMP